MDEGTTESYAAEFFFFPSNYSNDSTKLTWNKLTFVVSRFDITEARDAERIIRQWLGMTMYHEKAEAQHKRCLYSCSFIL